MRTLRRYLKRLVSWASTRQDKETLEIGGWKNISPCKLPKTCAPVYPPVEARRQALLKFGAVEAITDPYREQGTAVC